MKDNQYNREFRKTKYLDNEEEKYPTKIEQKTAQTIDSYT